MTRAEGLFQAAVRAGSGLPSRGAEKVACRLQYALEGDAWLLDVALLEGLRDYVARLVRERRRARAARD